jgi:hypothetical protein
MFRAGGQVATAIGTTAVLVLIGIAAGFLG